MSDVEIGQELMLIGFPIFGQSTGDLASNGLHIQWYAHSELVTAGH